MQKKRHPGRAATRDKGGRRIVSIKDLPAAERPRERLLALGAGELSNAELLAILLGTGDHRSGASALDLALRILRLAARRGPDVTGLSALSPEEMCQLPGIGPAKAACVAAAVELGRRLQTPVPQRRTIQGPVDVAELLGKDMGRLRREHFKIVLVNTKHQVVGLRTISIGSLDQTMVHPREVFQVAIREGAAALILAHNHPSGDPSPSPDDLAVTRRLVDVGRLVGIPVLDHVIIGEGCHASVREEHPAWFE